MKGRRTNYEIYWEILVFCREPRSFTSIINRCDLNSKIGQQHIQFLTDKKFLSIETLEKKRSYTTTEQAHEYISLFSQLYRKMYDSAPEFKL
ncbi:MAG: winged helix-turn-helix domain-containing protein [Candidatus Undinarchaeales archaeon]|nr:winged helix-turn-helix domain-containing protein [Candidatus Undinarchaeales archaeon]